MIHQIVVNAVDKNREKVREGNNETDVGLGRSEQFSLVKGLFLAES